MPVLASELVCLCSGAPIPFGNPTGSSLAAAGSLARTALLSSWLSSSEEACLGATLLAADALPVLAQSSCASSIVCSSRLALQAPAWLGDAGTGPGCARLSCTCRRRCSRESASAAARWKSRALAPRQVSPLACPGRAQVRGKAASRVWNLSPKRSLYKQVVIFVRYLQKIYRQGHWKLSGEHKAGLQECIHNQAC